MLIAKKKASRRKNIANIHSNGAYEFLKQSIPALFSNEFKGNHPDVVEQLIEQYKGFDAESLAAYQEAMMQRPDRTEVLKKFLKPILFIVGRHDNAVPLNDSLQLCHMPAFSYIHMFEESGHMGMMEETEKVIKFCRILYRTSTDRKSISDNLF